MAKVNLKQIEAFVQVAEAASFRRAAEKLSTTQPNISSRISALESILELKLFERDAASVRLTPMGETLLPKAKRVIRITEEFLIAADKDHLFEGVLRLGVTEMIVHTWLSQFLTEFKKRYPKIDVELTVDLSSNLSLALFNRSIDIALQTGPFQRKTLGFVKLGQFPLVWVAATNLGFDSADMTLNEICENPILTHAKGTRPYEQLVEHVTLTSGQAARLTSSTNLAACLQMTRDGLGIACLPLAMVSKDIESGVLTMLNYSWTPDPLGFVARFEADITSHYVEEAANIAQDVSNRWH